MKVTIPYEVGDLVYAIDYMESKDTKNKFYTITNGVISSLYFYTSKKETEYNVLLEDSNGKVWGIEIPLDYISKDKEVLIKKVIDLIK